MNSHPGGDLAEDPAKQSTLFVRSVEKAFCVLEAFTRDTPSLGLTEVIEKTGLDKSSAQRFLYTLEVLGYVSKNAHTRKFELTVKCLGPGANFVGANRIVQTASPYLTQLSKMTEETVNLAVRDKGEIVFLSRMVSRHIFRSDTVVGSRLPLYCTAAGLAILSHMPEDFVADYLSKADVRQITPFTITDKSVLLQRIAEARRNGFALCSQQYLSDDVSLGAAILDGRGNPVAAISISISIARYSPEVAAEKFGTLVSSAASSVIL